MTRIESWCLINASGNPRTLNEGAVKQFIESLRSELGSRGIAMNPNPSACVTLDPSRFTAHARQPRRPARNSRASVEDPKTRPRRDLDVSSTFP